MIKDGTYVLEGRNFTHIADMKILNLILGVILICLSLTSCYKDNYNNPINCDQKVVISAEEYNTAPNHQLTINNLWKRSE